MRSSRMTWAVNLVVVVGVLAAVTTPAVQAKDKTVLFLDCFSIQMDSGRSGNIEIGIERWSEPEERQDLATVLVEQGTDKLLKAVQKIKPRAGFIRTPNSLGWDVHFAQQSPLPGGGTKVVFMTDRPISGLEARQDGRSMDYQFQLGQIHLDKDGGKKGAGHVEETLHVGVDHLLPILNQTLVNQMKAEGFASIVHQDVGH